MNRYAPRVASVVAVLLATTGCNPFSGAAASRSMTVEPDGPGSVFVRRAGQEIEITGRFSLASGDVVRSASPGARILLESSRAAVVADGSRVRVTSGGSLEVLGGSVLADSPGHMTLSLGDVTASDVTASTNGGVLRVDLFSATAGIAAYEGDAFVAAPGQERVRVRPLFDATVTAGEILSPKPYLVAADDPWDRLHLTHVVELDEQLERYADAIAGQLGGVRLRPTHFQTLEGRRAGRAIESYLKSPAYSPADLLIGFSIADLDESRSADSSLSRAFQLRQQGGQWGVIATIMGVRAGPLVAGLEDLIFAAGALASAPGGTATLFTGPAAAGDGGARREGGTAGGSSGRSGSDAGDNDGPGSDDSSGGSGDSGGTGGDDGPSPPAEEDCDNLIDCVIDVLPLDTGVLP